MSTELKAEILKLVRQYADLAHSPKSFIQGESHIPISGKVYGANELEMLVESSLDFWLTTGRFNDAFEKRMSEFLNIKHVLTVNSGSSANLLAIAALTSPLLEDRAIKPGDEVITVASGFPTTLNPILLYGLIPVFVDIQIPTYNIDAKFIEEAISDKTRVIMIAHTLGNPFDLDQVMKIAKKYNLWVIEDCCDALGSTYNKQLVGSFGDIGTLSFYPAHHITMGEGGAVFTKNAKLKRILESIRDWGRDCWCDPGKDNTCGKRFDWQLGSLPHGYDHKYIYSHVGYNLKITDMQAAVGLAQMERLPNFIRIRKQNFQTLKEGLGDLEEFFILPKETESSDPAWFGFPITIRNQALFSRKNLIHFLNEKKIGTRLLFGGNLIRQPYMKNKHYRVAHRLISSDLVMDQTFWLGVYPGLNELMINYVVDSIKEFISLQK